mgnify:CR=1 FL=1
MTVITASKLNTLTYDAELCCGCGRCTEVCPSVNPFTCPRKKNLKFQRSAGVKAASAPASSLRQQLARESALTQSKIARTRLHSRFTLRVLRALLRSRW